MNLRGVDQDPVGDRASVVAHQVVRQWATDVDRQGRFPTEAFTAIRQARLLSTLIPPALGGEGATLADVAQIVELFARSCASTALIYAMHQIQVACLLHHGHNSMCQNILRDVADHQMLLGSATSENGVNGDIRSSTCALEQSEGTVRIDKHTRVISYAEEADALLITARRTRGSPLNDQVLVLCRRNDFDLERTGGAELLGLRGTRSLPYRLRGTAPLEAVLNDPFDEILATTMLPVAHTLWSAVWLGIATEALHLASQFIQAAARKTPGILPVGTLRLSGLTQKQYQMRELTGAAVRRIDSNDAILLPKAADVVFMNNLKVSTSSMCVDVVSGALMVTGLAGYQEEGTYAMGRMLRDAYGGLIMVNNDRLITDTAQLLLSVRTW